MNAIRPVPRPCARTRTLIAGILVVCAVAWTAVVRAGAADDFGQDAAGSLAVVVNEKNTETGLSASDLRRIVTGELVTWPHGGRVTLVLREPAAPERVELLRLCCRMTEPEYERLLLLIAFKGGPEFAPRVVTSTASIGKFIFNVPGAVGIVPASEIPPSVKAIRIDGRLPGEPGYPLRSKK